MLETKIVQRPALVRTLDASPRIRAAEPGHAASNDPDDLLRIQPIESGGRQAFRSGGTAKPNQVWPDYLEALELINGAGQAMAALEDHSERIQTKAFELTEKAKTDRLAAGQQIASLQQRLAANETRVAELERLLAEAELRAQTAQQWLRRFLETINSAFARHRAEPRPAGSDPEAAA
jgi:hypothetical protein